MKKLLSFLAFSITIKGYCQQSTPDTNFTIVITSAKWMPDGKALMLNVVNFDKTEKTPPVSKGLYYKIADKKFEAAEFDGGGRTPSPDGKVIAFFNTTINKRRDIYLYDRITKQSSELVADTFSKFSLSWSPDGKKIAFNRKLTKHLESPVEVCIVDIKTKKVKQITESGNYKSYNPEWAPEGDKIVYYLEKGDGHDQVWLTDARGSFHTNLTNDTTTHNYFPSWLDKNTIIYTMNPETIMTMKIDGSNKQKVEGINTSNVKYNSATKKAIFVTPEPESNLVLFDWEKKANQILLKPSDLEKLF